MKSGTRVCPAVAFALLALPVAQGCGASQARVEYGNKSVQGEIVDSNAHSVFVKTRTGSIIAVERDQINGIDHPGEASAVLNGTVLVTGLAIASAGAYWTTQDPENECPFLNWPDDGDTCNGPGAWENDLAGGAVLLGGLALAGVNTWLLIRNLRLVKKSEETASRMGPRITPTFSAHPQGANAGVHVSF